MKRSFVIGLLIASLATLVSAQIYMGLYWIGGSVSDPDDVGTEGRQVVFFQEIDEATKRVQGGYADDLVGAPGLSGRADQYLINALEDMRLAVHPGTYYLAIVQGEDGYGADPIEITVTGQGYDYAAYNLVLARGAGVFVDPRPTFGLPEFSNIRFGRRLYQPALVERGQEFIVSSQPRISASVMSEYGLDSSSIAMVLNAGTATARTFSISSANIVRSAGPGASPTEIDFVLDFYQEGESLPEGTQQLTFRASNSYGENTELCSVTVAGGEPRLIGVPITFPSPLHLKTDREVIFQYTMTHDIPVDINVFDVGGRNVWKRNFAARTEGGSAGVNKVSWNLITDQGTLVGSGIYVFTLINRENGKLLGKGKFTALP